MELDLQCRRCRLSKGRTQVVPPDGDSDSPVCLVGEAPGATEDREGRPFVGRAGRMLDQLMEEVGLERHRVHVTNAVKCRPPGNRNPRRDELESCFRYLEQELVCREIIVAMGRTACRDLLGREVNLRVEANRSLMLTIDGVEVEIVPTYHPAACLFNLTARDGLKRTLEMVRDRLQGR